MQVKYDVPLNFRVSRYQNQRLAELRVQEGYSSMAEVCRAALNFYIDHMADAVGSKRLFSRSMNQKLEEISAIVLVGMALQNTAVTNGFASLLNALVEDETAEVYEGRKMLFQAAQATLENLPQIENLIQAMVAARIKRTAQAPATHPNQT
jgi:hypothetical protein